MASQKVFRLHYKVRKWLESQRDKQATGARVARRASVLLLLDKGWSWSEIVAATGASTSSIGRIRRRYETGGLDRALYDAPRPGRKPRFDAKAKKHLIALACTPAPQGYARWTCELLAERCGLSRKPSANTISLVLKSEGIKPWREKNVVHPGSG